MLKPAQVLLNDIDSERQKILNLLEGMTQKQQNFSSNGSWSPLEVVHHLLIAEKGALLNVKKYHADSKEKSGVGGLFRAGLLNRFLLSKRKSQTPKVADPRNIQLPPAEELIKAWRSMGEELRTFVEAYPNHRMKFLVFKHPIAGKLDMLQTLAFIKTHIIHHGYQFDRIQKSKEYPK